MVERMKGTSVLDLVEIDGKDGEKHDIPLMKPSNVLCGITKK